MTGLSASLIFTVIGLYFLGLFFISYFTGKNADQDDFFTANRNSKWYLVAFGMIGASLSGVTFISIPGAVGAFPEVYTSLTGEAQYKSNIAFSYMQMVFGYFLGYVVISLVLLPLYYRLQLTSIYTYLEQRFGTNAYKIGAAYFLLSRIIGASFRLYLVAIVFQTVCNMAQISVPFWLTVAVTIALIWLYTYRGGIKTIVITDTLQTLFMLGAAAFTIYAISDKMGQSLGEVIHNVSSSQYGQIFFFENGWSDPNNFFKQFISGALITIVMTGLDQDMMQKNLSCRNLKEAKINMISFATILIFVNMLFLGLGALLYIYGAQIGLEIPTATNAAGDVSLKTDLLYPVIALQHLSPVAGIAFILGIIAAAYSSADSALTSLTTSFCVDFLGFEKDKNNPNNKKTRRLVHLGFSVTLFVVIILFHAISNDAIINDLFKIAGYTYGPLLGLFAFGIFTKRQISNALVIPICLLSPVLSYFLNENDLFIPQLFNTEFSLGFLIILLNGILTFLGLLAISTENSSDTI